jgi:DNA helicase-2/ATP-dependent DNA helicase PcrA
MILRCVRLLQEKPDLLAVWRERFQWILVDEFQDVSPSQYRALQLLAAPANNLFVVGDDDQSIYGFRGTDPLIMQRFLSDYVIKAQDGGTDLQDRAAGSRAGLTGSQDRVTGSPDREERIVFLTANYRCGSQVIRAASSLIRCNKYRIDKAFRPGTNLQGSFLCLPFSDRDLEYSYIAAELKKMSGKERGQTAVIFRTHGAAASFVRLLHEQQVPFLAAGTGRRQAVPTDRTRILQDLCAYYRAAISLGTGAAGGQGRFSSGGGNLREDLLQFFADGNGAVGNRSKRQRRSVRRDCAIVDRTAGNQIRGEAADVAEQVIDVCPLTVLIEVLCDILGQFSDKIPCPGTVSDL